MPKVLLFIKDFQLGSEVSVACVDNGYKVEFSDEHTDPQLFDKQTQLAIVDMDEKVFASVGLVSALKRKEIQIVGTMKKINNRDRTKLRKAGCDIIFPKTSLAKNVPKLLSELIHK